MGHGDRAVRRGHRVLVVVGRNVRRVHASTRPNRAYVKDAAIVGSHLTVRTGSLLAVFLVTTAIASRIGDAEVAAHQIAFQVWYFLALALDAIAIAAQAIVGRDLGAADAAATRRSSRRMIEWGVVAGVVACASVILFLPLLTRAFTHDAAVQDQLRPVLWVVALMQPIAAIVFVLDGILIGAGDSRYLALAMAAATAAFFPAALLVLVTHSGLLALWGALYVFMIARLSAWIAGIAAIRGSSPAQCGRERSYGYLNP